MVLSQNSLSVTIVLTDRVIRLLKSIIIGPSVLRRLNYERLKKMFIIKTNRNSL
jgi:hypothetical protein